MIVYFRSKGERGIWSTSCLWHKQAGVCLIYLTGNSEGGRGLDVYINYWLHFGHHKVEIPDDNMMLLSRQHWTCGSQKTSCM